MLRRTRRSVLLVVLAYLGVGSLYVWIGALRPINYHDEGFPLYAAVRVLGGEAPYRDFWSIHPPGQWYTLALLFKLFGSSMLVARIWDALLRVTLGLVLYGMAARLTGPRFALLPWALIAYLLALTPFYSYMMFPALLGALLALYWVVRHLEAGRSGWLWVAGLAVGLAALYRHDVAAYAAVAGSVVLLGRALVESRRAGAPSGAGARDAAARLVPYWAGALAVVVPASLLLVWLVPARELWDMLVVYPVRLASTVRTLPVPAFLPSPAPMLRGEMHWEYYTSLILDGWIPFYFGPIAYVLGAVSVVRSFWRAEGDRRVWGTALLTLFGGFLVFQALSRADAIHLLPTQLVGAVVMAAVVWAGLRGPARTPVLIALCVLLPVFSMSFVWSPILERIRETRVLWPPSCSRDRDIPRARCFPLRPDEARAVEFIRSRVPPGERIFVGHGRHDRVFLTDALFYFLADRPSATRYFSLEPGVATTAPVQQEIIGELERHRVRALVLVVPVMEHLEPNESGRSSGVALLDEYIRAHYQQVASVGEYTIWGRR